MRKLVFFLAVSICALTDSGVALAQASQQQAAKQHFEIADKAYKGGDYPKAVEEYLTAYKLAPLNPLLFNIGQAYRMSGDKENALSYYTKYVKFEPRGDQVAEAKQHISEIEEAVETAKKQRELDDADRQRAQAEADAKIKADAARAAADRDKRLAESENAGKGLRTGGLVVGGIGVAALGVGIAVAAGGSTGAGLGVAGGGVAAIAAGTAMYFIGKGQQNDAMSKTGSSTAFAPAVGPSFVGAVWAGAF